MIDLHSHVLPGIDDGARDKFESLAILEHCVDVGVTHIMFTPHIHLGPFNNNSEIIRSSFEKIRSFISEFEISIKIAYGSEVRLCPEIVQMLSSKHIPFIGRVEQKDVLLLELPHSHVPAGTDVFIHWLLKNNILPVIPHPERNRELLSNYSKLKWLKQTGALFQITAGSLTGKFGSQIERLAYKMLEDKLVYYVASDVHNLAKRSNEMGNASIFVSRRFGNEVSDELFLLNPRKITSNIDWV